MVNVNAYLHSKAARNKIPLGGNFELSPVCNFSCRMCYVRKTPEQIRSEGKRLRTWQEWLELGRQCRDAGMLYLLLTGGEPFLYPGFRELYSALHEMGIILSINSNGTLINEETVAWLKEKSPQRINITLYGASPETYERVCGNASGYDKAVHAIDLLREAGIPVVINASMIPENEMDLERIVAFGRDRKLNTRVATYMFPPARREREQGDSRFSSEESAKVFLRKVRCMYDEEHYLQYLQNNCVQTSQLDQDDWGAHEEYMRCRAGRSAFWVSWDGSMSACAMMDFPVSVDPFENGFPESWYALTNAVRQTTVLKGCAGCSKKEICKPCAAMLYAEAGDPNAKVPYLCELADHITCLINEEAKKYGLI